MLLTCADQVAGEGSYPEAQVECKGPDEQSVGPAEWNWRCRRLAEIKKAHVLLYGCWILCQVRGAGEVVRHIAGSPARFT